MLPYAELSYLQLFKWCYVGILFNKKVPFQWTCQHESWLKTADCYKIRKYNMAWKVSQFLCETGATSGPTIYQKKLFYSLFRAYNEGKIK